MREGSTTLHLVHEQSEIRERGGGRDRESLGRTEGRAHQLLPPRTPGEGFPRPREALTKPSPGHHHSRLEHPEKQGSNGAYCSLICGLRELQVT